MRGLLNDLFHWSVQNPNELTAVSTAMVALATIVLAFFNYGVIKENRLLRRASLQPLVQSYLHPHPDHSTQLDFVIANVGRGPAFDVKLRVNYSDDLQKRGIIVPKIGTQEPLPVLPPGETIRVYFGSGPDVFKESAPKPLSVDLTYTDIEGKNKYDRCIVSFNHLSGYTKLDDQSSHMVKTFDSMDRSLTRISNTITRLVSVIERRQSNGDAGGK